MSPITTHVLDVSLGRPAASLPVTLERHENGDWRELANKATDSDGRVRDLLPAGSRAEAGIYRLTFDTARYFAARELDAFYPCVQVVFELRKPEEHHHVPLLLSPFGYSTYRGS